MEHQDSYIAVAQLQAYRIDIQLLANVLRLSEKLELEVLDHAGLEEQGLGVLDDAMLVVVGQVESDVELVELDRIDAVGSNEQVQLAVLVRVEYWRRKADLALDCQQQSDQ